DSFVVGDVMCTFFDAPEASVPKLHVNTPPLIEQRLSEFAASIDQERPACVGSVSLTVTVRASPAPVLVAVIVKPIGSPADTVAASAAFASVMLPQFTVVDALA